MARPADRLPENAPGDYFVDHTCIDCDTCRQISPTVFARSPGSEQSIVFHQPETKEERLRAAMALVTCPTSSIGTATKSDTAAAASAFPERILDDVFYCGYASESSFGASSYLIRRPDGNVLVDSPRAARPLTKRIRELGGVRTMILTHRDDVADHRIYHEVFGCERVIHADDVNHDTSSVEVKLAGTEPVALAPDLLVIPVPGHTRGSVALLYRNEILFSGDHLWGDDEGVHLEAGRGVCWYSWAEQTRSMERLLRHRFLCVLPGHGRRYKARSVEAMQGELSRLVTWMKRTR